MTGETTRGRSVETVQAELRALESRTRAASDPALRIHVDHLRQEHEEARRARQRQFEDELMTLPSRTRPT